MLLANTATETQHNTPDGGPSLTTMFTSSLRHDIGHRLKLREVFVAYVTNDADRMSLFKHFYELMAVIHCRLY